VARLYDLSVAMTSGGLGIVSEVPAKFVLDQLLVTSLKAMPEIRQGCILAWPSAPSTEGPVFRFASLPVAAAGLSFCERAYR
jgi:hypothetical protein